MEIIYENEYLPEELNILNYIRTKELQEFFKISFKGVKSDNYCGLIYIDGKSYFIAPKIVKRVDSDRENLNIFTYMLLFANGINLKNRDLTNSSSTKSNLFELFIELFSSELLKELKRGIFKEYITQEGSLKSLRGKYLVEKNLRNFKGQTIYCEFDEFSQDNELNRFFLYAIKELKRFSNSKSLRKCETLLDEVSYKRFDIDRVNLNFNRLNQRFKRSFSIALMILKRLHPLIGSSKGRNFAFLFSMAEVFEKFVARLFVDEFKGVKVAKSRYFGDLKLIPDIIIENRVIIDTKYKKMDIDYYSQSSDRYQIFTYGINFNIKDTILLYPKHIKKIDKRLKLGRGENSINLTLKSLDLYFNGDFKEYIEKMRERIKEIL